MQDKKRVKTTTLRIPPDDIEELNKVRGEYMAATGKGMGMTHIVCACITFGLKHKKEVMKIAVDNTAGD